VAEEPKANGGRFAPKGVKPVYASAEEETALREVTSRKATLGGRQQIRIRDYPRMTYILSMRTIRNIDLSGPLPSALSQVVSHCLRMSEYAPSQELASLWIAAGIESVVFPSATGAGRDIVIYLANAGNKSVVIHNRDTVLATIQRANRKRDR
jgi:RES domain-containing protein